MHRRFTGVAALMIAMMGAAAGLAAQITETEKALRTQTAAATEKGWKTGGLFSLSLAQNSLTNWAAGGEDSLAVNVLFSLFANHTTDKGSWTNTLDVGYGVLKQGADAGFRKTDDKIDFVSKYGRQAFKDFFLAGLFSFKTQMKPGYDLADPAARKLISRFFAPAYMQLAAGVDYKPDAHVSLFVAPLSAKFTFVTDKALADAGAFGVAPGKRSKSEMGGYVRLIYSRNDFKSALLKNVVLTSKLDLFSNYLDRPGDIDVNWENLIGLKINKFLSVDINTQLVYDADIRFPAGDGLEGDVAKVQFKEIFGVGLSLHF